MGPRPAGECGPKGLTNNRKEKALVRRSDCQVPDRRTGARGLLRGPTHQLVQWEGEGEVSPPGICISTGCPTTWVLMVQGHSHHGEVRPPVSQLPGSRARIARLEILEHFLLHTVQSREERRDVSSEVGRHGLSDFFFF